MLHFSLPWIACNDSQFDEELRREVCSEHVLYGVDARVIARRQDLDDFLFELSDSRYANVHLTWSKELDPTWPSTEIYESREIMEQQIKKQIDEWNDIENS